MIFIDANIFLAIDNVKEVHHKRAKEIFYEIEQGKYGDPLTSDYVFNELVGVTFRKKGKEMSLQIGEQVINSVFVKNIDRFLLMISWKSFKDSNLTLNLVDCTNISVMEKLDIDYIATFDKEFKKVKKIKVID